MERIEADEFTGPRAYFTHFDHRILPKVTDLNTFKKELERTLKILILTKSTVVCAASHLTTPFVYQFFKENPILLNRGLIVPALRRDKTDVEQLFDNKPIDSYTQREMIEFYKNEILKVVNWTLQHNSEWFKERYLGEIKNDKSVLRMNLKGLSQTSINHIISEVDKYSIITRGIIEELASSLSPDHKNALLNFRELVYHMSGARIVNCESTLPQENYIDYSLADMNERKIILSEFQIFWKIFIELVFESMYRQAIPVEFMDILSFEDIIQIRKRLDTTDFKSKYDNIINTAINSVMIDSDEKLLYNINEILSMKEAINHHFQEMIDKEFEPFMRKKVMADIKILRKSSVTFGLGLSGFFEPVSLAANTIGVIIESPSFLMNMGRVFKSKRAVNSYELHLQYKERVLRKVIQKSHMSDKNMLLDVVSLLMETIKIRVSL